ncbi:MAG: HEAT repeat domain-containing protein [Planctomycetota bacterium]
MKTILAYAFAVVVAGFLAWLVFHEPRRATEEDRGPDVTAGLPSDPMWYRRCDTEERLASARFRLSRMTSSSVPAQQAGPMKDEIALLCLDEAVVDMIVSSFEAHPRLPTAELSAYMEIFSRVRHAKFEPLLVRAVNHDDYEPQVNAVEAARVQASARAVPFLDAALANAERDLQMRVVRALGAIGTASAVEVVRRHLPGLDRDAIILGIPILAGANYREGIPVLERLLRHEDPDVEVLAAFSLARLGRGSGLDRLAAVVRDPARADGNRAQALQFHFELTGAKGIALDREILEGAGPLLAGEALCDLVRAGDATARERARAALESLDAGERSRACLALGRSADESDLRHVEERLDGMSGDEIKVFLTAVGVGRTPAGLALLERLALRRDFIGDLAIKRFADFGEVAVDPLIRSMDAEKETERFAALARALASIPSPRARDHLASCAIPGNARLEIYVRSGVQRQDLALLEVGRARN